MNIEELTLMYVQTSQNGDSHQISITFHVFSTTISHSCYTITQLQTSKSYSFWPLTSSCHKGSQMTYLPEFILESVLLLMFLLINLIPEVGHQQKILVIFCLLNSSKTINSLSICYTWDSTESIIVIRVLEKKGDPIYKKRHH